MSDFWITSATFITLCIGIIAAVWKFWKWLMKGAIGKEVRDKEVSESLDRLSSALEEQKAEIEALKELSHKEDIRQAEVAAIIEQLTASIKEVEQDFKDIMRLFMEKGN